MGEWFLWQTGYNIFDSAYLKDITKKFDPSTPSMRKGRDGEKNGKKTGGKKKKRKYGWK